MSSLPIGPARPQAWRVFDSTEPRASASSARAGQDPEGGDSWPSQRIVSEEPNTIERPDGPDDGERALEHGRAGYPTLLQDLPDPPDPLYVRGRLDPGQPAVAIVGARDCTRYGRGVAGRLAAELAGRGISIVSGLARGIDSAAHRGAVDVDGHTTGVLPGGLDRIYPPRNRSLARAILRRGALVTEHPPETEVGRWSFPKRNRIIAGLAHAVIVVEAALRSGARITARLALDYGREVLVVPGPITSPVSRGCHALLGEGAHPCTGVEDVVALLPPDALERLRSPAGGPDDGGNGPIPPEQSRILTALAAHASASIDELHARTRMPLATLLDALTALEIRGRIEVSGDRVDLINPAPTVKQ